MQMIIGGRHMDAGTGETSDVVNPATGAVIDTVPSASAEDVERALDIAQDGKRIWGETPYDQRAEILYRGAALIREHLEHMTSVMVSETGKPYPLAADELRRCADLFVGYAERVKHFYGYTIPNPTDMVHVLREPLGVVACIIPFNYPALLYGHKVAAALAAGNAVLIKPASYTPLTDILLTDLLLKAGVPQEAVQIVTGSGEKIGNQLAASAKIDGLTLTGSASVSISVSGNASREYVPIFLELGGNDPFVVLEDADIDQAAAEAVAARTLNAGQACIAPKRFLVHNTVRDTFTHAVIARLKKLQIGDPANLSVDMGPVISRAAAKDIERLVQETVRQGGECLYGGKHYGHAFFEPCVLAVDREMDVMKDMEIFGPVFPIVGFQSDEEAVDIANQSRFGLSAGVLGRDAHRAARIAAKLECGGVVLNGTGFYRLADMPYACRGLSGLGSEGISTLEEMTRTKTLVIKNVFS